MVRLPHWTGAASVLCACAAPCPAPAPPPKTVASTVAKTAAPGPAYGSTRYTAEAGGRHHAIVMLPDPCVDDISGERFPAAVLIEVDGRRLRGCGTPIVP